MSPLQTFPTSWTNAVLRLLVGGFFLYTGLLKIIEPAAFSTDVGNYRLVPHEMVNFFAITLPWVEVVAGLLLVFGIWTRASSLVISLMLVVFIIAVSQALARGLDIKCGCFGTASARKAGASTLVIEGVLLAMSAWLYRRSRD